ncbi:hypothetical protein FRC02_011620 [Tulasnella sp. 418]|nr:hypothetical protein FRC02_011620 [Tulasnella sp. 418]
MIAKSATRPPPSRSIIRGSSASTPAPTWKKQRVAEYVQTRQTSNATPPATTLATGGSFYAHPIASVPSEYLAVTTRPYSYQPASTSAPELTIQPISAVLPPQARSVASSHTCSAEGSLVSDDTYSRSSIHQSIDAEISSLKHILTQELGHIFALPVYHFLPPSAASMKASMRQMRINWVDFCLAHGIDAEAIYFANTFRTYARHFMSLTASTWQHRGQQFSLATLRSFVINLAYIINSFARDPSLPGSPIVGPNLLLGSTESKGLFRQLVVHSKYLRRHYGTKVDGLPFDQLRLWA